MSKKVDFTLKGCHLITLIKLFHNTLKQQTENILYTCIIVYRIIHVRKVLKSAEAKYSLLVTIKLFAGPKPQVSHYILSSVYCTHFPIMIH